MPVCLDGPNFRCKHKKLLTLGTGILLGAAHPAFAQDAQVPGRVGSDDIVVTARRVSESLSKVPVAVSAFGAEMLQQRAVFAESDLQRNFAGLTVRAGQTNNLISFSIRGQSIDQFTGSQPGVLPYVNEVQLSSFSASSFYDLDSIQVLKGPQGTLFGRNATGGAVLFTTAKPTNELGGFVTGRVGNLDLRQIQGAINVPVVDDQILLRVAGDLQRRDGFQRNLYLNTSHGKIDRESGRVSLTLRPTGRLSNDTVFQYSRARGDNIQLENFSAYYCGQPGVNSVAACLYSPALDSIIGVPGAYATYQSLHPGTEAYPNGFIDQQTVQKQLGPYKTNTFNPSIHRATDWSITNSTSFELADGVTLKNIFGYGKSRSYDQYDSLGEGPFYIQGQDSGTPNFTGTIGVRNGVKNLSDELQLIGNSGGLNYIVGAYYSSEKKNFFAAVSFIEVLPFIPKAVQVNDFSTKDKSKAFYAQLTQDLSGLGLDNVKLTGGIRYTWETFSLDQGPLATARAFLNAPVNPGQASEEVKNKKPSWNVSIDYQLSDSTMVYLAHRGSWRTGGINGQGPARALYAGEGGNLFKPETTYDFEAGAKFNGRVMGIPLRANLAVYNQIIKDVQRVIYVTTPAQFAIGGAPALQALTVNIPKARVRGFELDGSTNLTSWLELGGSLTHTDARFLDGSATLFGATQIYGTYADTPRWSGTVYAALTLPLPKSAGEMVLRGDLYSQTGQWFSNQGTTLSPQTFIPGYTVINSRLEWNVGQMPLTLALFAKNLTKEEYFTGGLASAPFGTNGVVTAEPRTYGFEATVRF